MDRRLKVDAMLKTIDGVDNVYFAPSTNTRMTYPCIRYELSNREGIFADNQHYISNSEYTLTYITRRPSESIDVIAQIEAFKFTTFERTYVTDGLYHYVYRLIV